jgi:hypothetical protein
MAPSCLNPANLGFTHVRDDENFCRRTERIERGPAFLGAGGLRAEPRRARRTNGIQPSPFHAHQVRSQREDLRLRRPQRAVRPFERVGVAQRVVVAVGADVPRSAFRSCVRHSFHRLAARGARLPDRMEHGHLFPPVTAL